MKASTSCLPHPKDKVSPLLCKPSQFQYFSESIFTDPIIPVSAATIPQSSHLETVYDYVISGQTRYANRMREIESTALDLALVKTRAPSINSYWMVMADTKKVSIGTKAALYGDHVASIPEQSLASSLVD